MTSLFDKVENILGMFSNCFLSPLLAKPKGTSGLRSVSPSVLPSVCQSISISFPDFFPKCLQILTWFLAWKSITIFYRSSLSFVTLHWFLAKLLPLKLSKFQWSNSFSDFFFKACKYWPDFQHVSQSSWLKIAFDFHYTPIFGEITDLGLSKFQRSNSFLQFFPKRLHILSWFLACQSIIMTYRSSWSFVAPHWFFAELRALDLVNFTVGTVFQTFFLYPCRYCADFWHVSQSPAFLKAMHTKTETFLIL